MPSRAKQQLIVVNRKDGKTKGTILIIKKTGYLNIWINGKQYYYDYSKHNVDLNHLNIEKIIQDIEADQQKRRGIIVIKRK